MKGSMDVELSKNSYLDAYEKQEEDFLFQAQKNRQHFTTKAESIFFVTLLVVLNIFLALYLFGQ